MPNHHRVYVAISLKWLSWPPRLWGEEVPVSTPNKMSAKSLWSSSSIDDNIDSVVTPPVCLLPHGWTFSNSLIFFLQSNNDACWHVSGRLDIYLTRARHTWGLEGHPWRLCQ